MAIQRTVNSFIWHNAGGNEVVFEISDEDISSDPSYFGYISIFGSWIIQKRDAAAGTYRYYMGKTGYVAAWTGRAGLTYVYYDAL